MSHEVDAASRPPSTAPRHRSLTRSSATRAWALTAGLAISAGVARAVPLLFPNGVLTTTNYDEGVYLAAAGLFSEGKLPYRDFVFLHPPGVLLLTLPVTILVPAVLEWDQVLTILRWAGVLVGVSNVLLLVAVTRQWRGWAAGLTAGALYAGYGPAAAVERHLLLEPWLVLLILLGARLWLGRDDGPRLARMGAAGALLAVAGLVKITGGLVLLAALATPRGRSAFRDRGWLLGAAAITAVLVLVPFGWLAGPGRLWSQVVTAQLKRPGGDVEGGSVVDLVDRLVEAGRLGVLSAGAVPGYAVLLGWVVLAAAAGRAWLAGGRDGRFWVIATVVLLAPPLLAPDWYVQYPVPGVAAACVLLGAAAGEVLERWTGAWHPLAVGCVFLVVAGGLVNAGRDSWRDRPVGAQDFASVVRKRLPPAECVVAEPPALGLAIGRLPIRDSSGTYLADPFGALLMTSIQEHVQGRTAVALKAPAAQDRLRAALSACRYVLLHNYELAEQHRISRDTATWFRQRYVQVPSASTPDAALWEAIAGPGRNGARPSGLHSNR